MKHVWILNHYAQDPARPGSTRHYALARQLPGHGWKASIIAASVDHSTGEQQLVNGQRNGISEEDGVTFCRLRTSSYVGNGLGRMRNMLQYTFAAMHPKLGNLLEKPDAIIGSSVHPFAAWAGLRLARRFGVPFVFEVRDLWPQTLVDMGQLREGSPLTRFLRHLEKNLAREAERIIVLLPRATDYIRDLGISEDKVVWIPNGVDLDMFPPPQPPAEDDGLSLLYVGAHGQANGLDNLLSAMKIVEQDRLADHVTLRFVGDGPMKQELQQQANDLNLRNVSFCPPIPKSEVPQLMSAASGFVLCVRDLPQLYRYGISMNKIFDYMAAGRPTIISTSAVNNPIAEAGAGISVPAENPQAFAEAIIKLKKMPRQERLALGAAARRNVEQNYGFRDLASKLAHLLDECCVKSEPASVNLMLPSKPQGLL